MNKRLKSFIPKLILFSLIVGILVGVLELFIGHRYILDPLLYNKDPGFVYESYFAPTYYGFSKSVVVAITFFLVYLFTFKNKMKPILKAAIIGAVGTLVFGIYYYLTFPHTSSNSSWIIGLVHFTFIFGITYIVVKLTKFK
jgi:hypothetical protein